MGRLNFKWRDSILPIIFEDTLALALNFTKLQSEKSTQSMKNTTWDGK